MKHETNIIAMKWKAAPGSRAKRYILPPGNPAVIKAFFAAVLFLTLTAVNGAYAQQYIDKVKFFTDTSIINATLTFNIKKVLAEKDKQGYIFPATFTCKLDDGSDINDHISIEVRGHSRRAYCYLPPLKLIYKNNTAAAFYHLKSLKLVSACMVSNADDQNLLKEFLIYKIYNLITERSFRVRLLNLNYKDSLGKKKTITEHAFLLEDIKEVAKRNNSEDWTEKNYSGASTDRRQMQITSIFEYMIGNTDWGVMAGHNIRTLHTNGESTSRPYTVPYDFDSSGLVNTSYAIPDERLGIENVRQRLYMGLPMAKDELNEVLPIFNAQKANIYALINNFNYLTKSTKKEMINYLDEFFKTINKPSEVKDIFSSSKTK
jgi:hypothetical protein